MPKKILWSALYITAVFSLISCLNQSETNQENANFDQLPFEIEEGAPIGSREEAEKLLQKLPGASEQNLMDHPDLRHYRFVDRSHDSQGNELISTTWETFIGSEEEYALNLEKRGKIEWLGQLRDPVLKKAAWNLTDKNKPLWPAKNGYDHYAKVAITKGSYETVYDYWYVKQVARQWSGLGNVYLDGEDLNGPAEISVQFVQMSDMFIGSTTFSAGTNSPDCRAGCDYIMKKATVSINDNWRIAFKGYKYPNANLYSYLLHEFGHALNLGESADPTAIMKQEVEGGKFVNTDDAAGIVYQYGPPKKIKGTVFVRIDGYRYQWGPNSIETWRVLNGFGSEPWKKYFAYVEKYW